MRRPPVVPGRGGQGVRWRVTGEGVPAQAYEEINSMPDRKRSCVVPGSEVDLN
jgi:hypothetical protein